MKKTYAAISNLEFLAILAFLAVSVVCRAGTLTGQITTAANGAIANGTLTLTLNQYAVVSGTAALAPAAVNCYTDALGNVVGLPNPLAVPVLSANLGSGSLPSGTYYVVYAWSNSTGTTFYSPESSILLTGAGTLIVAVPASPPAGATNWKIFIGASSLGETQQISQGTPFSNYSQATALSAGAALPASNTSACSLRFNDELVPSFTKYNVSLKTQSGAVVSGFPMFWQLFGGNAGTINVSNGYPLASNAVVYPFPIVSNPNAQSTQSINGGLNLNGFPLTGISSLTVGTLNSACNANQQTGTDLGAKINACLATPGVSEIDITASGTISTQVVINNQSNILIKGVSGYEGISLTNGITGNPAPCAIKITGASQKIVLQDFNIGGNSLTGASGNGNGVCIYGTGGTPSQITFIRFHSGFQQGNGIDGTGASMPAAGLYLYQTNTIQIYDGAYGGNQVGIEIDGGAANTANLITVSNALIAGNLTNGILTKNGTNHVVIGPGNDIINNGTGSSASWVRFSGCGQYCAFYGNYIEGNAGLAAFTDLPAGAMWDISWNHWLHGGTAPSTTFVLDSSQQAELDFHDNWITSTVDVTAFIDLNPSSTSGKLIRNNVFDCTLGAGCSVTNAINWQGTQAAKCIIEGNTFGSVQNTSFNGTTAVDVNATGCRVQDNHCFTNSGILTNCVKVESASSNTFIANTTTAGSGTITNAVTDSGTNTTCIGQGCAIAGKATITVGSGTAAMTTGAINSLTCGSTITVAATSVVTTDTITWAFNAPPAANPGELVVSAWPTSGNVNFQYCNPTAGAVTPNAATLNWRVVR